MDTACPLKPIEKATRIIPPQGKWQVYFIGFSRSGWTNGAQAYREEVERRPPSGKNWRSAGMRLLDLEEVDGDLGMWAR